MTVKNLLNTIKCGYLTELDPSGKGISATPQDLVSKIVTIGIGVGGFAATVLIIFGGITMLTSAGDGNKVKDGQDMIVNALMGLALILMAVVIVRTAGVDILGIPDFTKYF